MNKKDNTNVKMYHRCFNICKNTKEPKNPRMQTVPTLNRKMFTCALFQKVIVSRIER